MQVSVSNNAGLQRQMTVTLPAQQIEQEVSKRLSKLRKTAKLPGFRPGKIPASVIDKKFGADVLNEIANEMINRSYIEALTEQKLEPATRPNIEPNDIVRGQDLEYSVTFDVFPAVDKTDLAEITIEKRSCEISDEDIDSTIDTIRKQRLEWNESDSPAEEGHRVTIDFKGTIDGEVFEGGEASDYPVVIGEGMLLKDFEAGMVGMKNDETKTIDVAFPDDYPAETLAGKTAQFEITAKKTETSVLPELDEEFIKSLGIEDGQVQSFRDQVKDNMQREVDNRVRAAIREDVFKTLSDNNEVELPSQLVEDEAQLIRQANIEQMKKQGLDESQVNLKDEEINEEAAKRVKLSMIVREVITANEIKLEKEMLQNKLNEMAQTYEDKDAFIRWYMQDQQRLQQLESTVLEELVIEKLLETAEVVEKSVPFSELMDLD